MKNKVRRIWARTNKGEQTMASKIIIGLLDNHKMNPSQLSKEVDYPKHFLSGYLTTLKRLKLIGNEGYGQYVLTELGKKASGFLLQEKDFEFVPDQQVETEEPVIEPNVTSKPILDIPPDHGALKGLATEEASVEKLAWQVETPINYQREVLDMLKLAIKALGGNKNEND